MSAIAVVNFIDAWLEKDVPEIKQCIKNLKGDKSHSICQFIYKYTTLKTSVKQSDYFNELMDLIGTSLKINLNLYCVLLCLACERAYFNKDPDEHQRVFYQFLNNLDLLKLCDSCKGICFIEKARIYKMKGKGNAEYSKLIHDALKHLKKKSGYRYHTKVSYLLSFTELNESNFSLKEINELHKEPEHRYRTHPPEFLASLHYEANLQIRQGLDELEKIKDIPKFALNVQLEIIYERALLYYKIKDFEKGDKVINEFLDINPKCVNFDMYKFLMANRCMIRKEFEQSKLFLKDTINNEKAFEIFRVWASQLYLNAELSQNNIKASRRILQNNDQNQTDERFRPFWARLYLLEGDMERASDLFNKLKENSFNVLVFFEYAYEVNASQLVELVSLSNEKKSPADFKKRADAPSAKTSVGLKQNISKNIMVGESIELLNIKRNIELYAQQNTPVLITGDTGTGKEVAAKLLHQKSDRADQPFLAVNCGAISETLMEAELFGYKKGAFTGANQDHKGLFESAGNGTVFLDEISSMPLKLQASLLRVLENMEVRPVGSTKQIKIKAKIIAATNVGLEELVEGKLFRLDLYFRLNRLQINLPALKDRKEDIPFLIQYFLNLYFDDPQVKLNNELMSLMISHQWPGNIRELKNEIERMAVIAGDNLILTDELIQFSNVDINLNKHTATKITAGNNEKEKSNDALNKERNLSLKSSDVKMGAPNKKFGARNYAHDRREQLKTLFEKHKHLTRAMVVRLLGCATNTASKDLNLLAEEGFIERIVPTDSPRSSYYLLIEVDS